MITAHAKEVASLLAPTTKTMRELVTRAENLPLDVLRWKGLSDKDQSAAQQAADGAQSLQQKHNLLPSQSQRAFWKAYANLLRLMGPAQDTHCRTILHTLAQERPDPEVCFDLGLLHKTYGRWSDAHRWFGLALEHVSLAPPSDPSLGTPTRRAVLWNLAICATAMGDLPQAEGHWEPLGLCGQSPPSAWVRVPALSDTAPSDRQAPTSDAHAFFEAVPVQCLSPCHGIVVAPPRHAEALSYGDTVVWDGKPVGMQESADGTAPVFPLLEVCSKGTAKVFETLVLGDPAPLVSALGSTATWFPFRKATPTSHCPVADDMATRSQSSPGSDPSGPPQEGRVVLHDPAAASVLCDRLEFLRRSPGSTKYAIQGLHALVGDSPAEGRERVRWSQLDRAPAPPNTPGAHGDAS